jgi:hypothetical protein
MAIVNAFKFYIDVVEKNGNLPKRYTQKMFVENLALQLGRRKYTTHEYCKSTSRGNCAFKSCDKKNGRVYGTCVTCDKFFHEQCYHLYHTK